MKYLILVFTFLLYCNSVTAQTDATPESMNNLSSSRIVSGSENQYSFYNEPTGIPVNLLQQYHNAGDDKNETQKLALTKEIEKYLDKTVYNGQQINFEIIPGSQAPYTPDWYGTDVQVTTSDVVSFGGFRQMDMKQGEDGWMYLAVNRRNAPNNGYISVYKSSNGGALWVLIASVSSAAYYGSVSMLVESRNNSVADSTRILLYYNASASSNLNDAGLYVCSFRRDGSSSYIINVASPAAGNRFTNVSACSDGVFYQSSTYMHAVVREETNAGAMVKLHHFRTTDWGNSHTSGTITSGFDDKFPVCAYSNENGLDSIYIAVERVIDNTEHEIRLFATPETPVNNWTVRYITDAASGTIYERPSIAIQQRHFSLPQRILVTCTKNDRAVYHYSNDGGAVWNIDYGLGLASMQVDYTSCSSDTLAAGDKDFIAAFVDLNGDSVTVRHGDLGSMGAPQYKKNTLASTGVLAPVCTIYKEGNVKYSAFAYAGVGPSGVYYNMESLITGIHQLGNEVPSGFSLHQNYPNPFNPVTNIKFSLPEAGFVKLAVYDVTGREVAQLVNQNLSAGTFNYDFDASGLSSGIYFYRISTGDFTDVKKMMLVK